MQARALSIAFTLCILLGIATSPLCAQQKDGFTLRGTVADESDRKPLPYATVQLLDDSRLIGGCMTDAKGEFALRIKSAGSYELRVSFVGYTSQTRRVDIPKTTYLYISIAPESVAINEVVVTASEKKGMTSTSVIDRQAMEHLQPSSFTDLLALLPGGQTHTPDMGSVNNIRLREVGVSDADYSISSLGTKFIIDGANVGTDANMQFVQGSYSSDPDAARNNVSSGVDMRTIPTDNIEKVEIIRGIPSVKYGDLTSGVVKITRKMGDIPWEARFKADQYGKLLSVGKGVEFAERNFSLNADGGFFDSRVDPRNTLETFKRINLSLRLRKKWNWQEKGRLTWNVNTDYSANIDNVKNDPDILKYKDDKYKSSYHSFSIANTLVYTPDKDDKVLRSIKFVNALNLSLDKIAQTKLVQLDRDQVVPLLYADGEYDGTFLPYKYVADYEVDGRPLYANTQLDVNLGFHTGIFHHAVSVGAEWQHNKNFGRGQVYDISRPMYPGSSRRPRSYRDIPATSVLSFFLQDEISVRIASHKLSAMAGVRTASMLNIGKEYAMHGKIYADPRLNLQWDLPKMNGWNFYFTAGVGRMSKMPTMADLYPDKLYLDFTQMSYWHSNPDYKRINIRTYTIDRRDYDLTPAHNLKWEARFGFSVKKHDFSITYFHENMNDGFRSTSVVSPYQFKKYDTSGINSSTLTGPPSLDELPYRMDTVLRSYSVAGNGSRIMKEGIEFQYSSPRFKYINTRLTVNGAWFHTIYENSRPEFYGGVLQTIGNVAVNDKYIGFYDWKDGYIMNQFTSNFILDTYIDKLGLIFSVNAECFCYGKTDYPYKDGQPIAYMDVTGTVHPYTDADLEDTYRQWLNLGKKTPEGKAKERFYMNINFKATKQFGKYVGLSFFADRILNYAPDYEVNGFVIRRAFAPYFGMELNIKI